METSDIALQTFDSVFKRWICFVSGLQTLDFRRMSRIWRIFFSSEFVLSSARPAALFRVSRLRHEVTLSHTMLIITMLLYCLRVQILVTSVSQSVSTAELIWIWCEHAVVLVCWASVLSSWQIGLGSVLEQERTEQSCIELELVAFQLILKLCSNERTERKI